MLLLGRWGISSERFRLVREGVGGTTASIYCVEIALGAGYGLAVDSATLLSLLKNGVTILGLSTTTSSSSSSWAGVVFSVSLFLLNRLPVLRMLS